MYPLTRSTRAKSILHLPRGQDTKINRILAGLHVHREIYSGSGYFHSIGDLSVW